MKVPLLDGWKLSQHIGHKPTGDPLPVKLFSCTGHGWFLSNLKKNCITICKALVDSIFYQTLSLSRLSSKE